MTAVRPVKAVMAVLWSVEKGHGGHEVCREAVTAPVWAVERGDDARVVCG